MKCSTIFAERKESCFTETSRFLYKSLLGLWFYAPPGYLPQKPGLHSLPHGVWLGGRMVYTILITHSLFDMIKTNADAVLANFFIIPGKSKLSKIFSTVRKPVIVSVGNTFTTSSGLAETAKKLEIAGAAGLYTGRMFPLSKLKKICSECSIPVFSASAPETEEITSKINAGVFAVCIQGKNISRKLMKTLRESFPYLPVIALCNRSQRLMERSVILGTDVVIFKPCVPFQTDW